MKIIIPRIPRSATRADLKRFVFSGVKRRFRLMFFAKPQILDCEILRLRDATGAVERHGIVSVFPEKSAHALVRAIHGMRLNGKRVAARAYRERQSQRIGVMPAPAFERRRPNLRVDNESDPVVEGYLGFAKELVF